MASLEREERVNILLVDDRPEQRLSFAAVLSELGENIVQASSGREALRHLLRQDFAVILLDVHMPGMDGFETASLIRQRRSSENTPIIFITAFSDDAHAIRGYSLGAVDYILAPAHPEVLRTKVGVFVELFKKNRQLERQRTSLERRAEQLKKLTDVSLAIHSATTVVDVLQIVTDSGAGILQAHQCCTAFVEALPGSSSPKVLFAASEQYAESSAADPPLARVVTTRTLCGDRAIRLSAGELEKRPEWTALGGPGGLPPLRGLLAAPLLGRDGRHLGVVALTEKRDGDFTDEDLSLLVQLSQMTAIAIENTLYSEARKANRIKDEFLGMLSHELRTPLQAMVSWIRILRTEGIDDRLRERGLDVIEQSVKAQVQLIEDLLDVSRIVSGKLHFEMRPLNLATVVEAAVGAVQPAAVTKGIELQVDAAEAPCAVFGDPHRLQQVVWNLLSNAVKFTPEGGCVQVRLDATDSFATLEVADNGAGIASEFLPHIFERFRQSDSTSTREHKGLGLGLAIVRHLVELHGGTIRAESEGPGKGARFTVTLPQRAAEEPTLPATLPEAPVLFTPLKSLRLDGISVMVVDDEKDARDGLAVVLESYGARVTAVGSVAEACLALQHGVPDVLLSDLAMPGEDGYSLIGKLRALDRARGVHVPAAAITAYGRIEDRGRAISAGFDAHLHKPVEPRELAHFVKDLISREKNAAQALHPPPPGFPRSRE